MARPGNKLWYMATKTNTVTDFSLLAQSSTEAKFDTRLLDKKLEHGFMTRQERDAYLKALEAEADYEFTSAEALDAES